MSTIDTKPTVDHIFKRTHPEDLTPVRRVIENAKEGESLDFEHRLLMPDGSVKHVHVIARPLTSESNEVEFVGTVMDVTVRKKAFEEIRDFTTTHHSVPPLTLLCMSSRPFPSRRS